MTSANSKPKIPVKYTDLPKHLQQKYKNSILFAHEAAKEEKKFEFDPEKIKKRKIDKEKTIEQKLQQFTINPTQYKHLVHVFSILSSNNSFFGLQEITNIMKEMGNKISNAQIDRMIWEFDDDLDKQISFDQFVKMYKKCIMDKAAAQPKKLFHLTQFLMYCKAGKYRITVQDTLELLYVRALQEAEKSKTLVKDIFEESIKVIFGQDYENDHNGVQKEINFQQYLQKINKKAIEKRKKEIEKIKSQLRYS